MITKKLILVVSFVLIISLATAVAVQAGQKDNSNYCGKTECMCETLTQIVYSKEGEPKEISVRRCVYVNEEWFEYAREH